MTKKYVEEDKIKVLLTDYSNCLITTYIANYFDEDLKSKITLNINERTPEELSKKFHLNVEGQFSKALSLGIT